MRMGQKTIEGTSQIRAIRLGTFCSEIVVRTSEPP